MGVNLQIAELPPIIIYSNSNRQEMQGVRKKRQQLTKEIRSKQRFQKLAQNRDQSFGHSDHQSLVTMIFYMIEKQTNQGENIDQESFEQFLDLVAEQIRNAQQTDQIINQKVKSQLLQRYSKRLEAFEEAVLQTDSIQRLMIIQQIQNAKMFDLMRFLFRIQLIKDNFLQILDALLDSAQLRMAKLCGSDSLQLNSNYFIQELSKITQFKTSLLKQLLFLYQMINQINSKNSNQERNLQQSTKETQIVQKLIHKWITSQLLFQFTFNNKVTNKLKNQKKPQIVKINSLVQSFLTLYIEFIYRDDRILPLLLDDRFVQDNPQKLLQLIFTMLFSLDESFSDKQNDISGLKVESKQYELFLFIDLSTEIIKKIQQNNGKNGSPFLKQVLQMIINLFYELPSIVIDNFLSKYQIRQVKGFVQLKDSSGYFVSERLCDKLPMVVRMIRLVEDMDFCVLVNFVQLLAILASYSDHLIETMFRMEDFSGYYGQVYNFKSVLEMVFVGHVSLDVRRRGLWLLSNITGSEEHYSEGFYLIEKFFLQNILEQDYSLIKSTKEELVIHELIIQTVMNYLSNLKQYGEVKYMMEVKRVRTVKGNVGQVKETQEENLLGWVMELLSSVVRSIAQSRMSAQKQKFLQVVIYSLYNILTLEVNKTKCQNQTQSVVLILIQRLEIPNNLELIYNQTQTSHQQQTYMGMLETLLDQIQKAKRLE